MKKRKKLIKRVGAVLCALVVAVSTLGLSVPYYASEKFLGYDFVQSELLDCPLSFEDSICEDYSLLSVTIPKEYIDKYGEYYVLLRSYNDVQNYVAYISNAPLCIGYDKNTSSSSKYAWINWSFDGASILGLNSNDVTLGRIYTYDGGKTWKVSHDNNNTYNTCISSERIYSDGTVEPFWAYLYCESNHFVGNRNNGVISSSFLDKSNQVYYYFWGDSYELAPPSYNSNLGYLQNVRMNTVFDDVPLGENVGETYTTRWYYDQFSTTGIDLTSGDYFIRYYQERWIVKGYGEDDVVEKSDRYILGDFIVQNGYIETYSVDVESTLHGQGYEEPSFIDLLWNKFVTTHYYFQIVDAKNNEVGGFLHIYLTDDNGKFGVELISETLDNAGNYDDSGYEDFIDEDKITSDDVESGFNELEQDNEQTLEEWFEDFRDTPIGDVDKLEGSEAFSTIFRSYVLQVASVSSAVGAVFALLPAWVLGVLGILFVLLFILILLNES